jgi:hypothetical protein
MCSTADYTACGLPTNRVTLDTASWQASSQPARFFTAPFWLFIFCGSPGECPQARLVAIIEVCFLKTDHTRDTSEEIANQRTTPGTHMLFLGATFSASGAIMGFLFAGHIAISAVAFASLFLGLLMGWRARGLVA